MFQNDFIGSQIFWLITVLIALSFLWLSVLAVRFIVRAYREIVSTTDVSIDFLDPISYSHHD